MNKQILHSLRCNNCYKPIRLVNDILSIDSSILHGLAACECSSYPIINGILLTVEGPILKKINIFIIQCSWLLRRCRIIPLFVFCLPTTKYFVSIVIICFWPLVLLPKVWYVRLMRIMGIWKGEWAERISHPGVHEADIVADKQYMTEAIIIDIGCGTCDFEKRHDVNARRSVGIDFDLFALYAAHRYADVGMNLWWGDMNILTWWFVKPQFNIAVCIDGFHYFKEKKRILTRMMAMVKDRFILTNIHIVDYFPNTNDFQHSLPLAEYKKLFKRYRKTFCKPVRPSVIHVVLRH